jgi:hypothetical protein
MEETVLNQIKTKLGVTNAQLLDIINEGREKPIHAERLYYWDKKDIWPSWALRKLGMLACT